MEPVVFVHQLVTQLWDWIVHYFSTMSGLLRGAVTDIHPLLMEYCPYLLEFWTQFTSLLSEKLLWSAILGTIVPILIFQMLCAVFSRKNTKENFSDARYSKPFNVVELNPPELAQIGQSEGRRWLRQADCDLQSAKNDVYGAVRAFEWVCFKCQQSAEKAIKSAMIAKGLFSSTSQKPIAFGTHDLASLALSTKDKVIVKLSKKLQGVIGYTSRMRYPDCHPYPSVPRDAYSKEQAMSAQEVTEQIIDHIQEEYFELDDED